MQDGELDLERMVEHCGDRLLRTCALYLGDVHSAEDAVQDTFLRALQAKLGSKAAVTSAERQKDFS